MIACDISILPGLPCLASYGIARSTDTKQGWITLAKPGNSEEAELISLTQAMSLAEEGESVITDAIHPESGTFKPVFSDTRHRAQFKVVEELRVKKELKLYHPDRGEHPAKFYYNRAHKAANKLIRQAPLIPATTFIKYALVGIALNDAAKEALLRRFSGAVERSIKINK